MTAQPGDLFAYIPTKHCGVLRLQNACHGPHIVIATHCNPEDNDITAQTQFLPLSWVEVAKQIGELAEGMAYDAKRILRVMGRI